MFGLQCLLPVAGAPGQQAGVAMSVFRGGKHRNWQGRATGALGSRPGFAADASSVGRAGQLCGRTQSSVVQDGDAGCALRPGGAGSIPSPSFPQVLAGF